MKGIFAFICAFICLQCSNKSSTGDDLGVCGDGFVPLGEASLLGADARREALRICVTGYEGGANISITHAGTLSIEGYAPSARLSFPALINVDRIFVRGCNFAGIALPVLTRVQSITLACDNAAGIATLVVDAPQLTDVQTVEIDGAVNLNLDQALSVHEVFIRSANAVRVVTGFESSIEALRVGGTELDALVVAGVASVGTLEFSANYNDLADGAFASLRRVTNLIASANRDLSRCALDRLVAQLDEPPDSTTLDEALGDCTH